eukprot:3646779-Pleurochrysis_carterae.AAC.1
MFAFNAIEANNGLDTVPVSALGLIFPGELPKKVELKRFLESFQDATDQKPYGAMLRGELPYAAFSLTPRNLDDIPPIADSSSGQGRRGRRCAHRWSTRTK